MYILRNYVLYPGVEDHRISWNEPAITPCARATVSECVLSGHSSCWNVHHVNRSVTVPRVEEDGERCFWLPQEQGGEHCVLGLCGLQLSASQTRVIPAAQRDVRTHQGLPFHNSLVSAPRSITGPEWMDLCQLSSARKGMWQLNRASAWVVYSQNGQRRAIIKKGSKLSAFCESNDPDKWHMVLGDPIKKHVRRSRRLHELYRTPKKETATMFLSRWNMGTSLIRQEGMCILLLLLISGYIILLLKPGTASNCTNTNLNKSIQPHHITVLYD